MRHFDHLGDEAASRANELPMAIQPEHLDGLMRDLSEASWCVPPYEDRLTRLYSEATWWRSKVGGEWVGYDGFVDLPVPPTDEEVMAPIVEEAMRAIGMSAPLRQAIPTPARRGRTHTDPGPVSGETVLNQWHYAALARAVTDGKTSEVLRQEWNNGMYLRGVTDNGGARITCRSPHTMEEDDTHGQ